MWKLNVSRLLVCLYLCTSLTAWAQSDVAAEKAPEPIYIESDRLEIDDAKGISTYSGNVHFRQGTAHFWGDEVVVLSNTEQGVEKVEAKGQPARFHQYPSAEVEELEGQAELISYEADKGFVVLSGSALLKQVQNQFAGNRIEYDANKKLVRAGKRGEEGEGRIQVIIQPPAKGSQKKSASSGLSGQETE